MKTNHRRRYRDPGSDRTKGYYLGKVQAVAMDGVIVDAQWTTGDHCRGKRGIRRDRAGAKKFVRSRCRRRARDELKRRMSEPCSDG